MEIPLYCLNNLYSSIGIIGFCSSIADTERTLKLARETLEIEADAVRSLAATLGANFIAAHKLLYEVVERNGRVVECPKRCTSPVCPWRCVRLRTRCRGQLSLRLE